MHVLPSAMFALPWVVIDHASQIRRRKRKQMCLCAFGLDHRQRVCICTVIVHTCPYNLATFNINTCSKRRIAERITPIVWPVDWVLYTYQRIPWFGVRTLLGTWTFDATSGEALFWVSPISILEMINENCQESLQGRVSQIWQSTDSLATQASPISVAHVLCTCNVVCNPPIKWIRTNR